MPQPVDDTRAAPTLLPTGTITFLMTDIEGSTRLLQELGEQYSELLAEHYRLLREAFASGIEVKTEGDAFFFAFHDARSAIRAAIEGQRRLKAHAWPADAAVRVRIGIHSGEGRLLGSDYVGLDVHRVARITAASHGGQIVVSDAARALAEVALPNEVRLSDLGNHRLKDLERSEHLFQVVAPGLDEEFPPLRSLDARTHNLPAQITSFVGREREKRELLELLGSSRLVTLTGPGGTGKTRLALEVASAALDDCADGVFFVTLATVSAPDLLAPTVATTLKVRESPTRPILERLIEHLAERALLLVLDNFEHLIDAAPTVGDLLGAAPRLRVLVTSREPLRIVGEQEFPVPALTVPDIASDGIDQLLAVDAVTLFVQRARSVRPGFGLAPDNARAVAGICARLDGLPLAIELAAARVRLFEPHEILARLDRRMTFLAGGRDLPARQRTLRGALDWSHELLDDPERALFRRFSVFAGGCNLDAVETVCNPQELGLDPVDGLSSLLDKSLIRRVEAAEELRVAMLETIREYARDRLEGSDEASETEARHAAFYLDLAERAAEHLYGPQQGRWLDILDQELDNVRAVIRRSIASGDAETGLRLAAALTMFWLFRGRWKEGRGHLEELLALPASHKTPACRAAALDALIDLMSWQGDYDATRCLAEEALVAHRELGNVAGVANQLSSLGYASIGPDPEAARELFRESIDTYREIGAPPMIAGSLIGMACAEMRLRHLTEGRKSLEEAERLLRRAGNEEFLTIPMGLLGIADRLNGDLAAARRRYAELLLNSQKTDRQLGITMALQCFADLALVEGRPERATVLSAAEGRLAEQLGGTPSLNLAGIPDVRERARAELGDERYEAALARGRSAGLEEIVQLALSRAAPTEAARADSAAAPSN
ncbi:MAG TPA: adenylate/guanylate cyclase domain-containing protein [Actinomycetota bacterium]|nr:adenylate/guanylate cyclase domain-containing protein [Actinomycetota bacterium]